MSGLAKFCFLLLLFAVVLEAFPRQSRRRQVDGNWGKWSPWGVCSKTCHKGTQLRTRKCNSPAPQLGGKQCKGPSSETLDCNVEVLCPADGNWGKWSLWGVCSKTCHKGTQLRSRKCNSTAAQLGGKPCKGPSSETRDCNKKVLCPGNSPAK